jgi:hypothetical protein
MRYKIFVPTAVPEQAFDCTLDTRICPLSILEHETSSKSREYAIFKRAFASFPDLDAFGVISGAFERKSGVSIAEFADFVTAHLTETTQCIAINPMLGNEAIYRNCLDQAVATNHKGFHHVQNALALLFGHARAVDGLLPVGSMFFCNYFVATRAWWGQFFKFVDSVVASLDALADAELNLALNGPAGYVKNRNLIGRIFLEERLFSVYLDWRNQRGLSNSLKVFERYDERLKKKYPPTIAEWLISILQLKQAGLQSQDHLKAWHSTTKNLDPRLLWLIWQLDDPPELPNR